MIIAFIAAIILSCVVYSMSFIFSIRFTVSNSHFRYMRGFYIYCSIAMVVSILSILVIFKFVSLRFYNLFNIFAGVAHYIFLGQLILKVLKEDRFYKTAKVLFWLFLFFVLTSIFLSVKYLKVPTPPLVIVNIGLIILSLFYFNALFDENSDLNIEKTPIFWVIMGIIICAALNIPMNTVATHLNTWFDQNEVKIIMMIGFFGFITMHLFFIKAFQLCYKQN